MRQRFAHVVIGDEDRQAGIAQVLHDLLNLAHGDRIDAAERLVEHDHARLGDQRARDGEPAFFTAGKRERELLRHMLDAELRAAIPRTASLRSLLVQRRRLEDREEVFLDGQFAEDRLLLRQVAHAHPRAAIHREIASRPVLRKVTSPAVRPHEADDHVKARRLARAIRPEQADDLAAAAVDIHAIHHGAAAVDFDELLASAERAVSR